jgi:peptidoglycan DL-endopeptidase LytE
VIVKRAILGFASVCLTSLSGVALAATTSSTATKSDSPVKVDVQSGQTLWRLSELYHVSVRTLEQWNHLTDKSTLQIGEPIVVGWSGASSNAKLSSRDAFGSSTGAGVIGEEIIAYSKQFLGTPYAWGGQSPSGFDCSGFAQFVFGHLGIHLERSSFGQYGEGVPVDRSALMPGDLVFFSSNGSGPSHVGVSIGDGQFINVEDRGVVIDSMYTSYWSENYYGARRVISQ